MGQKRATFWRFKLNVVHKLEAEKLEIYREPSITASAESLVDWKELLFDLPS